jgi:hypothetical protein
VLIWAQGLLGMKKKVELDSGDGWALFFWLYRSLNLAPHTPHAF